jgi:tRNA pseudouridine55 synthase
MTLSGSFVACPGQGASVTAARLTLSLRVFLPVFLGHATRLVEYHTADEKEYRALVAFGARSTTDDIEGELTIGDAPAPTGDAVEAALPGFRGQIDQVPPDYSAVRVAGRHAYELARHGRKPELRPEPWSSAGSSW